MQCTLDSTSLKPFVRALTCISKIGDNLDIFAAPQTLSISTASSAKSAYGRFRYDKGFFSRYVLTNPVQRRRQQSLSYDLSEEEERTPVVSGQLLVKSLLSILKHRTLEKNVERCDLSIVEGAAADHDRSQDDDETIDSLESKLIVKLHCKHGVIKTHRLPLNSADGILAPNIPQNAEPESSLTIGPRAMKDIVDHFPGQRSDSRLVWTFDDVELTVKSVETAESRGKQYLSTELTMGASDFEQYEIEGSPLTIAFYLREFNATIMYAESMSLPLQLRFTSTEPLVISVMDDSCESIFIISTTAISILPSQTPSISAGPQGVKRGRDGLERAVSAGRQSREPSVVSAPFKTPMKIVNRTSTLDLARQEREASASNPGGSRFSQGLGSLSRGAPDPDPAPSSRAASYSVMGVKGEGRSSQSNTFEDTYENNNYFQNGEQEQEQHQQPDPLFLPTQQRYSQIPPEDYMDGDALTAFLEDDGGEEVGFGSQKPRAPEQTDEFEALEDIEDDMMPTQWSKVKEPALYKPFQALFED